MSFLVTILSIFLCGVNEPPSGKETCFKSVRGFAGLHLILGL
jgi:hypothetical protein